MDLEPGKGRRKGCISQPPHLAVILPEILTIIMSYVPTRHLLSSVTFVSRGWEEAAREHLASRSLVELTPSNMSNYLDRPTHARPHKRVLLYNFAIQHMSPEVTNLLQRFISSPAATARITDLLLDYFPHGVDPILAQIIALFSTCPSLTCVRFTPQKFTHEMFQPSGMLPTLVKFPNITKLGIYLPPKLYSGETSFNVMRTVSQETILGIVALFPNVQILRCASLPLDIVEYFLSRNLSISEISVRLDRSIRQRPISIPTPSVFLTRVEFQIDIFNRSIDHYVILATFAGTLEKLKIFGVNVVSPKYYKFL
ncbi:uncharacterized protein LOC118433136 [Folsomia candida]|uniref:uncharacterized protein LOC118433136 n=1 Tax=Folsomia candida TaxID=158441 RepID=UPI0016050220|nr:uncharacterized protein LOC118433136 [Folsomia candida]XP_035700681.1 uncharacterized protein LOC118433136 [Folsomia candida]